MHNKVKFNARSYESVRWLFFAILCIVILKSFLCYAEDNITLPFDKIYEIDHPRLILPISRESDLREFLETDSSIKALHRHILVKSDEMIKKTNLVYKKQGSRLLEVSREALTRIFFLSYSYRMTNDTTYAMRAIDEILNVCSFRDWNETHFLDVAEMTLAVAIGYDWLYDLLDSDQKNMISKAIKEKAFDHVLKGNGPYYLRSSSNLNSVCNAGMLYGAIALYEGMPDIAANVIKSVVKSNPRALESYNPDGGYPEGYSYWGYGTTFQVLLMDALESMFGYEFENTGGFIKTGKFIEYMESPSGKPFNFSDCSQDGSCQLPMWWFAWKTGDYSLVYLSEKYIKEKNYEFAESRLTPLIPIFASRIGMVKSQKPDEMYASFQGKTPVYIYRSGWDSPKDTYLGIKGGSASTPHGHADAGSFVYEFEGIRWAMDLGWQGYYSIEKEGIELWNINQDSPRWDIMRIRNDCHNTLTIDSLRHNVDAHAEVLQSFQSEYKKGAIVDLTNTLCKVKKAVREVYLDKTDFLHVIDNISTGNEPIQLTWIMVTSAEAIVKSPYVIRLIKDEIVMDLKIETDMELDVKPILLSNTPIHSYDDPNPNSMRIGFTCYINHFSDVSISVTLTKEDK